MPILTQGRCREIQTQSSGCYHSAQNVLRSLGLHTPFGGDVSKTAQVSSIEDALCSTGDIRVETLYQQACARSHAVAFCCLHFSNAAAPVFPSPHCRTAMADSASESDTDGAGSSSATPMSSSASNSGKPSIVISQFRLEELTNRLASLQQENKVLKIELETFKLKCKALQEENRDLRKASVTIVSNVS